MVLVYLLKQSDFLAYLNNSSSDSEDALQIQFNIKLAAVFAKCAKHISTEVHTLRAYSIKQATKTGDLNLSFNTGDVESIITIGKVLKDQSQIRAIVQLVAILMNLPEPFKNQFTVNIDEIAEKQLDLQEEKMSSDNHHSLSLKIYELQILTTLLKYKTETVQRFVTFDKTLMNIVQELELYAKKVTSSDQDQNKKNVSFSINLQQVGGCTKETLTLDEVNQLLLILYNLSVSDLIVQTDQQRNTLVKSLYDLVGLVDNDSEPVDDKETPAIKPEASSVQYLTKADALPDRVTQAIISTIKMCITARPNLQEFIASKIQQDIQRLDQMAKTSTNQSRFVELCVEPLLMFQETKQIMICKHLSEENDSVVPFYQGMSGSRFNFSPLQSTMLTEKYLDLFYELFERQKLKTRTKAYKNEPGNANWSQLSQFTQDEMTSSTFLDITAKMTGQKNLLFVFEFEVNKEKLIACYFTFGQVDQSTDKKSAPNQKTSVPNCVGDFMMIGAKESQKVAVIADLLNNNGNMSHHGGCRTDENLALTWTTSTGNLNKGYEKNAAKNAQAGGGVIQIGHLGNGYQSLINLDFGSSKYKQAHGSLQPNYAHNFSWEFPSQFQMLSENDLETYFYSGEVVKFTGCEIWQWKTEHESQSSSSTQTSDNSTAKNAKDSSLNKKNEVSSVDMIDDLICDPSRQQSKKSTYYQTMSDQNLLEQNLVFDVPLTMTLEQLQISLEIDFTFNFMSQNAPTTKNESSDSLSKVIALDTEIGMLGANVQKNVVILVSDYKRLPPMMKKQSSFTRPMISQNISEVKSANNDLGISDLSSNNPLQIRTELPVMHKMAQTGGVATLVASALHQLNNGYNERSLAQIWIDLLTMYNDSFASLPGFESRYFTEERIDLIIKIITRKYDDKASIRSDQQDPTASTANKAKAKKSLKVNIQQSAFPPPKLQVGLLTPPPLAPTTSEYTVVSSEEEDLIEMTPSNLDFEMVQPGNLAGKLVYPPAFGNNIYNNNHAQHLGLNHPSRKEKVKPDETESAEHVRQKRLCEYHKKAAFDITRAMIQEELDSISKQKTIDLNDRQQFTFTKTCLEQNFFKCILDQLSELTRNGPRTKVIKSLDAFSSDTEEELPLDEDAVAMLLSVYKAVEKVDNQVSKKPSKSKKKKKCGGKLAGVGYTSNVGKTWDVNAYLKNKQAKNEQIIKLLEVLQMLADSCTDLDSNEESKEADAAVQLKPLTDQDEQLVRKLFLESALLPILESALRSGSILEMAKEFDLYQVLLKLTKTISKKQALMDILSDIGPEYQPRQKDSVFKLLKKVNDMSLRFKDCLSLTPEISETQSHKGESDLQHEDPKKLSEIFIDVYEHVSISQKSQNIEEETKTLEQILSMPLEKAYFELCHSFRLSKVSFRPEGNPTGTYQHSYSNFAANVQTPSSKKLIRLAQEIADLTESLPCEVSNSVFAVVDKQRVDFMKCVIMGSAGTPYAHGAFVYDIYFDENYPNGPPKINLSTTGGSAIRFNPNLYNCGKVCLSLLGTWRGSATENWNPKVSTLLQVILSIQAIIMSSEVYFNEPGYEHLMGTVEGERLNNGYSNIVRYGNLKYAMIEQLKNPVRGFEDVIRRNFFMKKDTILAEVDGWIERAKTEDACYTNGLTTSHNPTIAALLGESKDTYQNKLVELRKELVVEFNKLDSPFKEAGSTGEKPLTEVVFSSLAKKDDSVETKSAQVLQEVLTEVKVDLEDKNSLYMKEEQAKIDLIDVSYTPVQEENKSEFKSINIDDEGVKDRWSRYIGAMGIESVAKQAEAVVYIDQLGGLGIEVAKNITLAGCKELILGPSCAPSYLDLASQFFIDEKDVREETKESRVELCKQKLQELNPYVKISTLEQTLTENETCLLEKGVRIAVFTDPIQNGITNDKLKSWTDLLRSQAIQVIVCDQSGVFSRILTDFGPSHIVIDNNGEEIQPVMIQEMRPFSETDSTKGTLVELLTGSKHNLEEGSSVSFSEVIGMKNKLDASKSVNDAVFKVTNIVNISSFVIDCDSSLYSEYERNGVAKQIKDKLEIEFAPLSQVLDCLSGTHFDQNLQILDFCKMENFEWASLLFKYRGKDKDGFKSMIDEKISGIQDADEKNRFVKLFNAFERGFACQIGPLCAFVGGLVAQEVVKAITGKFMPIKQEMYLDIMELVDESSIEYNSFKALTRYESLERCLGADFVEKIRNAKVFMIGAGAIGCELLKNFAMVGLGTGPQGQISLTDPDVIELSNLNRQFLFREKHLRQPKSMTAAAAAVQMNPDLKGHISARLDKLHKDTEHIYNEKFFQSQTVIANALDNVAARLFIDQKCVDARVPLLDSGTLGAKGHVQVIIPHKTESYGSAKDPEENNEIPHCTLKMFPEETLHCVEWAKDMLGNLFEVNPKNFNKLKTANVNEIGFGNFAENKNIKKAIKMAKQKPKYFSDCIEMAFKKFYKIFRDNILQLLIVYPIDKLNADGRPFWSLPKREPTPQNFNPENPVHRSFVAAYACLMATMHGIEIPYEQSRSEDTKQAIAQIAALFNAPEFVPNVDKAKAIQSQVEKEGKKEKEEDAKESEESKDQPASVMIDTTQSGPQTEQQLRQEFTDTVLSQSLSNQLLVQEFEKDDDQNYHVDFIYACANVRAMNYSLEPMDWITVKLKAGRIVPALATTTAAVAGLQTIELLKLLKHQDLELEKFKNTFLNLAVPAMYMSEPGPPISTEIKAGLKVDTWTRWDMQVTSKTTLGQIVNNLQKTFNLKARDVMYQAAHLFFYALRQQDLPLQKQPQMKQTIGQLLLEVVGQDVLQEQGYADLTITFIDQDAALKTKEQDSAKAAASDQLDSSLGDGKTTPAVEKILENVPMIRVILKKDATQKQQK